MFFACDLDAKLQCKREFKDITKFPLILTYISIISHANHESVRVY